MERQIAVNIEKINRDNKQRHFGQLLCCMRQEGMTDAEIRYFTNQMGQEAEENFWVGFAYKYLGVFAANIERSRQAADADAAAAGGQYSAGQETAGYLIQELMQVYFDVWDKTAYTNEANAVRERICGELKQGVCRFQESCSSIKDLLKYEAAVNRYLSGHMSRKEQIKIQELPVVHFVNDKKVMYPLTRDGKFTIGIVNPWPGDKSAEAEVLYRMKAGAEHAGLGYVMLDNFGHILDGQTQKAADAYVNPHDLEFVITTHYDSEKTVDAFYYHTLWNPPEIPLNLSDYDSRVANNYLMNDDYLIYDFGGMSNHLRGILLNKPRTLEGASALTASFPVDKMLEPKLEDPKLFYCGMNWEKVVQNTNRHEGLFRLLDRTGKVKFFGPDVVEAWGGIRPWEGYDCYQYSIPFDGFSILKEINACGICLVLSSDIHRRAGAATNRTYEACAAGAVIISDDNEFMQHYFKDAALFIEYNKNNPRDTYEQIMEKYDWIIGHKEEALKMAKKAQEIFVRHFSVDRQLMGIVNNHYNRFCTIEKDLFAEDEQAVVLVTYVVNTLDIHMAKENCQKVIRNIQNQYYGNILLGIACDEKICKELTAWIEQHYYHAAVVSMALFDGKGSRQYTDGQAVRVLQKNLAHEFWMNTYAHEIWFYDHITTLIRSMREEGGVCAYAGRMHKDKLGYARGDFFRKLQVSTIFNMDCPDWFPVPGQLLFRRECSDFVPDFVMECLDGYEHYAYCGMACMRQKEKAVFTKRMTICWEAEDMDARGAVLKADYQIRYIRDLLRFFLPDEELKVPQPEPSQEELRIKAMQEEALQRQKMHHYFLYYPIRLWVKLRCYNVLLKMFGRSGKGIRRWIGDQYDNAVKAFEIW